MLQLKTDKLKKEYLGRTVVTIAGLFIIVLTLAIGAFLFYRGSATFTADHHSVAEFLFSSDWDPADQGSGGTVGAAIFIVGSILISLLALLISTPFSIAAALFMTEISPRLGRKFLQPAVEIFVGIPSVVYGWVGLTILVPFLAQIFHLAYGYSVLAGAIVLAVMIFPTITSVSADAIRSVPPNYKEAAYGLGSTRWQMIYKVVVPAAMPGHSDRHRARPRARFRRSACRCHGHRQNAGVPGKPSLPHHEPDSRNHRRHGQHHGGQRMEQRAVVHGAAAAADFVPLYSSNPLHRKNGG